MFSNGPVKQLSNKFITRKLGKEDLVLEVEIGTWNMHAHKTRTRKVDKFSNHCGNSSENLLLPRSSTSIHLQLTKDFSTGPSNLLPLNLTVTKLFSLTKASGTIPQIKNS